MQPFYTTNILSTLENIAEKFGDKWTRKRKQSPKSVFLTLFIMALGRGKISTRRALTLLGSYFPRSHDRREPCPTAFSKMRMRVSPDDLYEIFHDLRQHEVNKKPFVGKTYNGLDLISIDASQINTPSSESTDNDFGKYHSSHCPQGRLITVWNISTRQPIDWEVGSTFAGERAAAVSMSSRISKKSIVILDRGYFGVQTIKAFGSRKIPCLMRVKLGRSTWM